MIIPIVSIDIKTHAPIHFLDLAAVLCQEKGQFHQVVIIQIGNPMGSFQQTAYGDHVDLSPLHPVKPPGPKIPFSSP